MDTGQKYPNGLPICSPRNNSAYNFNRDHCPFVGLGQLKDFSQFNNIEDIINEDIDLTSEEQFERDDWVSQFKFVLIPRGTKIVHSSRIEHLLNEGMYNKSLFCWWNKTFPGQRKYKGGWFTIGTEFGGPEFGLNFEYILNRDLNVLWIPTNYRELYNDEDKEYINVEEKRRIDALPEENKERMWRDDSVDDFGGSHIIEGVKGWQEKGYEMLEHKEGQFADELGKRISDLGFYGYLSCDECELFISHYAMSQLDVISRPIRATLRPPYTLECGDFCVVWNDMLNNFCPTGDEPLHITHQEKRSRWDASVCDDTHCYKPTWDWTIAPYMYSEPEFKHIHPIADGENKTMIMLYGPPESGKTSSINKFISDLKMTNNFVNINVDKIVSRTSRIGKTREDADRLSEALYMAAIDGNYNVIRESTGRDANLTISIIKQARLNGYTTYLFYPYVPTEELVNRVISREEKGEQVGPPEEYIRDVAELAITNFDSIGGRYPTDFTYVYNNTTQLKFVISVQTRPEDINVDCSNWSELMGQLEDNSFRDWLETYAEDDCEPE